MHWIDALGSTGITRSLLRGDDDDAMNGVDLFAHCA